MFSQWLDARLPNVKIHQSEPSDRFLRKERADAMAQGETIYIKTGKYNPETSAGLGLLGHELTHVAQQQEKMGSSRADRQNYEHAALQNEQMILRKPLAARAPEALAGARGFSRGNGAAQRQPAMFAATSRSLSDVDSDPSGRGFVLPDSEMSLIKEEVYQDLMGRFKVEFERGA